MEAKRQSAIGAVDVKLALFAHAAALQTRPGGHYGRWVDQTIATRSHRELGQQSFAHFQMMIEKSVWPLEGRRSLNPLQEASLRKETLSLYVNQLCSCPVSRHYLLELYPVHAF